MKYYKVTFAFLVLTILYFAFAFILKKYLSIPLNEFGDFFGGIFNTYLTLISALSILYLSYIIDSNEDKRNASSIQSAKEITILQLRQGRYKDLSIELNQFLIDINNLNVFNKDTSHFVRETTKNMRRKELESGKQHSPNVWLTTIGSLENFKLDEYLFSVLFNDDEFINSYNKLHNTLATLADEHHQNIGYINENTLSNFIDEKDEILRLIGRFIIND